MKLTNKNKLLRYILFFIFFSFVILLATKHREAYRLYKVVTLFDEDQIVENFQRMSDFFPSKTIKKGPSNFKFTQSSLSMPTSFSFNGESYNIKAYLESTFTTGFVVIKDNQIVFEKYDLGNHIDGLHISWSVNKSFVSALIGIAIEEKLIESIQDPIDKYVYAGVSIEDILQMSSGVSFNEDYSDFYSDINRMGRVIALGNSINEFAASLQAEIPPGTRHHYVSMDTQVLGMLLRSVTKTSPSNYLEDRIWSKIGARQDAKWLIDDLGMELAFGTLNITLRDYARFGMLYLHEGNWFGEQIIPRHWIQKSVNAEKPHLLPQSSRQKSRFGYGYQWWLPANYQNDFLARGVYGQYIYVSPEHKVVIVKNSADPYWRAGSKENFKTTAMFQSIAKALDSTNTIQTQQVAEKK